MKSKESINNHKKSTVEKVVIDVNNAINYLVKLALSRFTLEPTVERNLTVVSIVLTPALRLVTKEDTC